MTTRTIIAIVLLVSIGPLRAAPAAARPLLAELRVGRAKTKVKLVLMAREKDGRLLCRQPISRNATTRLKPADISRIRFLFEYDKELVTKLRRAGRWTEAATVMARAVAPALPFLDVARNNGVSLAMRTGSYLMRGGDVKTRFGLTPTDRKAAAVEYSAALQIFRSVARAEWSERSAEAQMRACMCLVFLGQTEQAGEVFEDIAEPEVDSDEYGVYQLARAYYASAKGEWRPAIEAAVHSSDFETKDLNTFPSALMLTAQCYEELGEWYRARDVYYELGMLFTNTPWGVVAADRLKQILAQGRTAKDESVAARDVFFGNDEDINKKAREFLGIDENGQPIVKPKEPTKK